MAISKRSNDGSASLPFWRSRANLVGVVLAVVVIAVHLIVDLGALWPFVAVAAWAAAALLTPQAKKQLPPPPPVLSVTELREKLTLGSWVLADSPQLPQPITEQVATTKKAIRWLLDHFDELDDAPEQKIQYTTVIRDFLPELERNYREIDDPNEPRAVKQVIESLALIEQEAARTRKAIVDHNVMELENHAQVLKFQFGHYDNDLMPKENPWSS